MACVFWAQGALVLLAEGRPGVTRANFNRIEDGMKWEEVKNILGDDHQFVVGRMWTSTYIWQRGGGRAEITFYHGKVARKEWTNPAMVVLEGFAESFHR